MSQTPKTVSQLVEEITQAKRDQEAEGKRLAEADQQLQALTLWTAPDLVEAIAHGRVHIAPGHDPALTAPTSAQEALDLAWDLAHPVKEGQRMPSDTQYLLRHGLGYNLRVSLVALSIDSIGAETIRTLDPLPDPEPDWLDAPAVIATCGCHAGARFVWEPADDGIWVCSRGENAHWGWLRDVTPLYPKEDEEPPKSDTLHDAPRYRTVSFRDDTPWGTKLGGDPA